MYFLEFLETCTIGWVLICESGVGVGERNAENAFFVLVGGDGTHLPHPRLAPYTPPVEAPASSAPGTTAHDRQQGRPCQMQGRPPTTSHAPTHTPKCWTRCAGKSGRRRRWMAGNSSIMRIVIALSQAWSSDSNMHNYHINLLVYLVIVICYQVLDLPP